MGNLGASCFKNNCFGFLSYFMKRGFFVLALAACLFSVWFEAGAGTVVSTCVSPPGGLVSWWKGEDNAYDQQGLNNAVIGGMPGYASGKVGRAFSFNGVDQCVYIPEPYDLDGAYGFAIEGWIYPVREQVGVVFDKADGYYLGLVPGQALRFRTSGWVVNGASPYDHPYVTYELDTPTNSVMLNAWNHVAAVYDRSTGVQRMYVNGVRVAEQTNAPITVAYGLDYPASIGAIYAEDFYGNPVFYEPFAGRIDELSFYDFSYAPPLTDEDVAAIYQAGSSGKCGNGPVVITQPQGQTVGTGASVTFNSLAVGFPPLKYQWRKNGINIPGATSSSLVLRQVQPGQAGLYSVTVSDKYGTGLSGDAALTVTRPQPPRIVLQPVAQTGIIDMWPVTFSVNATGSGPLQYQWFHDYQMVKGATNATLSFIPNKKSDAGFYSVVVYNNAGLAMSLKAMLKVYYYNSGGVIIGGF
jgi:Concanavalin A-like lectin/glucanases superfamily/Immunoglobulin domain